MDAKVRPVHVIIETHTFTIYIRLAGSLYRDNKPTFTNMRPLTTAILALGLAAAMPAHAIYIYSYQSDNFSSIEDSPLPPGYFDTSMAVSIKFSATRLLTFADGLSLDTTNLIQRL